MFPQAHMWSVSVLRRATLGFPSSRCIKVGASPTFFHSATLQTFTKDLLWIKWGSAKVWRQTGTLSTRSLQMGGLSQMCPCDKQDTLLLLVLPLKSHVCACHKTENKHQSPYKGCQPLPARGWRINIFHCRGYMASVAAPHLCHCSLKTAMDNLETNGHDRVPTTLHLWIVKCDFHIIFI